MTTGVIILLALTVVALFAGLISYSIQKYNTPLITNYQYTDKQIIQFIGGQPDGLCSPKMLAKDSGLTIKEAKARLTRLLYRGLLTHSYSKKLNNYYSLKERMVDGPYPKLSEDPFLTIRDLLLLFKHFDYRLSIQDICLATDLPVEVIVQEMKFFLKEKIVDELNQISADGMSVGSKYYILLDPYRENPESIADKEAALDLNAKKLYEDIVLSRKGK